MSGLNRRDFMLMSLVAAASAGGSEQRDYLKKKSRNGVFGRLPGRRPHIVLISVDMISPDCYLPSRPLSQKVQLPNIRSIAGEGTRFDNCLTTAPLCGPARAAIFTGTYPPYLTNGERAPRGMQLELNPDNVIFQEYLRAGGYNTKHVGKCHVGIEKFMDAFGENDDAWNRWAPPLTDDDDYVAYIEGLGVKPQVYEKELRGMQFDRKTPGNSLGGWIRQANGKPFPLEAHYSMYMARKALNKVDAALIQGPDTPFYLQLDFFDPHQPFSVPAGFEERAAELRKHVRLPESYRRMQQVDFGSLPGEPSIYQVYRRYWGAYDPELVKDYIVAHLLQMEVVDHAVGMLLEGLRERNLWDESVIIFTADHGEMNGRRALFDKGVYFQPDIFRVPLSIKLASWMDQKRSVVDEPVSVLDISRTILDCARLQVDQHFDGESLLEVLRGMGGRSELQAIFQTGWHVGVNYGCGTHWYQDAEHHWFYGYNITTGEDELYDMAADDGPNLIAEPKYAEVRRHMIRRLAVLLEADRRWLGYWCTFRLHKAEDLPRLSGDMQMIKPRE